MTSLDRRIQRQETCRQQNRLPSETCLEESFRGLTIGGVVHLTERQYKLNRMTILVGMTGTDGIILAADQCMVRPARSAAEYDDRMDTCKIVHLQKRSTRLNSSHLVISYAVFCLKKKKHTKPHLQNYSYRYES